MANETVQKFFDNLANNVDPSKLAGLNATYQFNITGDGGNWYVEFNDGHPTVNEGTAPEPSITLTADAGDWAEIVTGQQDGQTAFLTGKLKIQGDMTLAMKLQSILQA